ncbi:MAG: trypsin-like peptidase domain-containing protein [Deltaproteobacteria bacterium]|nr:trypsin-like peptidase domain-containing protein [Deltaproteobacteria bacterium]
MKLKPYAFQIILLIAFIAVTGLGYCASEAVEKQIPLPIGEMTDLLEKWWADAGYQIQRSEPEAGLVRFHAIKGRESWQVDLAPHSALATRVIVSFSGVNPEIRQQQFWDHISHYILNPSTEAPRGSGRNIPTAVLSRMESVVCINARSGENNDQFSGFIIDTNGLVLCTAHALENSRDLTVTLYDGQEVRAKLLYKDPHKDLSLLQIALKTKDAIHLSEGRNLLGMGETIFTVGCPVNLRGTVYTGTINSPPRKMNDQPLWQARMEIYPGSSGSPVFDVNGKIVAMVKGRYRGTTTTAFLIPLETILIFFKEKNTL